MEICPHCTQVGVVNRYDRYSCIHCGYEDYSRDQLPYLDIATPHNMRASIIKYPYVGTRNHYRDILFETSWQRNLDGAVALTGVCPVEEGLMKCVAFYRTRGNHRAKKPKITLVDYAPKGYIVTANGKLSETATYRTPRMRPWTVKLFRCREKHEIYLDVNKGFCFETDIDRVAV